MPPKLFTSKWLALCYVNSTSWGKRTKWKKPEPHPPQKKNILYNSVYIKFWKMQIYLYWQRDACLPEDCGVRWVQGEGWHRHMRNLWGEWIHMGCVCTSTLSRLCTFKYVWFMSVTYVSIKLWSRRDIMHCLCHQERILSITTVSKWADPGCVPTGVQGW